MSKLVDHARRELILCGQYESDPVFAQTLLNSVRAFSEYGHSGGSAAAGRDMLTALLSFENLSPLTDNPAEWDLCPIELTGEPLWQNTRNSKAFSKDGGRTYQYLTETSDWNSDVIISEEYHA